MTDHASYAKGYTAGKRFSSQRRDQERFDRFMAAAMSGLLANGTPWEKTAGGVRTPDKGPEDWAKTAAEIARAMMGIKP